jgi:hypothetical protein
MRTPTQTGILVGAVAGLLAAGIYWAMQTPALNGLLILIEILLATGAGVAAAMLHVYNPTWGMAAPAPAPTALGAPTLPTAPPVAASDRSQRLRAAATAGGLAGLGWGLAGMAKVVIQITDPAFTTQLDSLIAGSGGSLPAGSSVTILGVGVLCAGCFALILFPGVGAGLGAVGGYILTAVRPAATRPQ